MNTPRTRVLVVEDDGRVLEEVAGALRAEGFEVSLARTLVAARTRLEEKVGLVLLDLGLPDGDGLAFCEELTRSEPDIPVILLTARDGVEERVRGLDAGADDYVVKPCHIVELMARVRSVLRRSFREDAGARTNLGELWGDPELREAGRGSDQLQLKPREFDLLHFLLQHPGRPWTRQQLLDRVWGAQFAGDSRTVDVHVRRLRAQIEDRPAAPRYLLTEWGVGYRLVEPNA